MRLCRTRWWRRGLCWLLLVLGFVVAFHQNMAQNSSPAPKRDINAVLAAHDKELLAIHGVVGVYVGTLKDRLTPCLKVMLVRKNPETERKIPPVIEGYPVVTEITGEIRALGTP
jgi:hypothetical protein